MMLSWDKKSNVTTEKIDMKKYITPGEVSKLEYPKAPKQKVLDTMTKGEEGDLEYPTTVKKATEEFTYNQKEVITPGEKGKLQFPSGETKMPTDGDVKVQDVSKIAKPYMAKGEPGKIEKAKPFKGGDSADEIKFEEKKYRLQYDKASPQEKQFSKKSGQETLPLADVVGFTLVSFIKWAQECPTCMKQLMDSMETYQYYPAVDAVAKKSAANLQDLEMHKAELQKQLAEVTKQIADANQQQATNPAIPPMM